MKQTF
jgi:hypothetical protein